ncbi:uncharacterized protein LOC133311438 [Gastrolobium bilobum]|uniref:uncharacterized protein LOC133311438 n=1 Tax=Gastrolobium bilobum TaxID=150636 RepID=UPI002AB27E0D|nr:uncharacterized protein LOC133311438 [Gastrolobium bilobum]
MEIDDDGQHAVKEEDATKGVRSRTAAEENSASRSGKKSKGTEMEGSVMDEDKLLQLNGDGGQSDNEEEHWIAKQKREEEEAALLEGLGQEEVEDPLCPRYVFSAEEHRQDCEKWRKSLIIKMLGKRLGARILIARLQRLWNLVGSFETIDLDNDFLLLRFQEDGDYRFVLEEGPWIVNDHYVVVQRWRPLFDPYDDSVTKMTVWLRIPGLPMELYTVRHLWRIGNMFGRTIKVDRNSLRKNEFGEAITDRGKFVRICVEIDLRRSFLSKFWIGNRVLHVGYEGLHLICFKCGLYGHRKDQCPEVQASGVQRGSEVSTQGREEIVKVAEDVKEVKQEEAFGSWMVVQRQPRSRKLKAKPVTLKVESGNEQKPHSQGTPGPSTVVTPRMEEVKDIGVEHQSIGNEASHGSGDSDINMLSVNEPVIVTQGGGSVGTGQQKKLNSPEKGTRRSTPREGKDRGKVGGKPYSKKSGAENIPPSPGSDGQIKGVNKNRGKPMASSDGMNKISSTSTSIAKRNQGGDPLLRLDPGLSGQIGKVGIPVKGVGKSGFPSLVRDLKFRFKVSILVLMEVKIGGSRGEEIARKLGFSNFFRQDPVGFSGGIWVLWDNNVVEVEVLKTHHQVVHTRVRYLGVGKVSFISFVYGSPRRLEGMALWLEFEAISLEFRVPWSLACIGRF